MIFLTTTLPYANSSPHVGHLLEFLQADCLARCLRKESDVYFNIGLDENGGKIEKAAKSAGVETQEYVDSLEKIWREFCDIYSISYDNFYRTSAESHHEKVKGIWNLFEKKGLIYRKKYSAHYCPGCESFKTTDFCEDHEAKLEIVKEENFFFNLNAYKSEIKVAARRFLEDKRYNELVNVIDGLDEISISRNKDAVSWGVQCPSDPNQTIYVWFDALLNYVIAADGWNNARTIQLCGPDNLKFQGYVFQAFLDALELKNTDEILVHGTVLDENGKKMSKSLGNTVCPFEIWNSYGENAVRFYLLSCHATENFNFSESELVRKWNELADIWGNLISRVLNLVEKCGVDDDKSKRSAVDGSKVHSALERRNPCAAIEEILALARSVNKDIEERKPWATKNADDIFQFYYQICEINELFEPLIPSKYAQTCEALKSKKKAILFPKLWQST